MEILNAQVREITKKKLDEEMAGKTTILFFTQESGRLIVPNRLQGQECPACADTRRLLEEIAALSDKIDLQILDFVADRARAESYGVDKIPGIVLIGEQDYGIRFFGIPSGYEYMSLIEDIVDVSRGTTGLSPATREALKSLDTDIRIQVFVTPSCPYCTMAVRLAHQMAMESPRITAEMIEATEFPHLTQKYSVYGVPKTIVNETVAFEGAIPEEAFLAQVLKAVARP